VTGKPAHNARSIAALNREWVEHWRRVGPLLEARRLEEAKAMTDQKRRQAIAAVLGLVRSPPTRMTSGLVEYYRKLRKLSP
jgi:hypothetical protein